MLINPTLFKKVLEIYNYLTINVARGIKCYFNVLAKKEVSDYQSCNTESNNMKITKRLYTMISIIGYNLISPVNWLARRGGSLSRKVSISKDRNVENS